MTWRIELGPDQRRENETAERLVEHNQQAVEEQAHERGCRWAELNAWEFQAPAFYAM